MSRVLAKVEGDNYETFKREVDKLLENPEYTLFTIVKESTNMTAYFVVDLGKKYQYEKQDDYW
jgi:hypothetical protein